MQFGVLGPLLVEDESGLVTLASAKQRALLAILLLETPHDLVPTERLIDDLWGTRPPATAGKALHVHVSQLRKALGPGQPIITRPMGYALRIEDDALDLHRFEVLVGKARDLRRTGDLDRAHRALDEALGLWRGQALADVTLLGPGAAEADRLESLRAVAHEERMELELARGGGASLVPELEALIANHPYRERMYGLLMLALYRAGRQADALAVFRQVRKLLVEDLGLEPGPELVRLEAAILAQDPSLDQPAVIAAPVRAQREPPASEGGVPRPAASILGREVELQAALGLIERAEVRLVTLTGVGGIGKTRLALELAANAKEQVHFVELASIVDPDRVVPAIGAAIGAEDGSVDAVAASLREKPAVLFLDNFEQVLPAAPAISSLLAAVPSVTAVVTSRAPLRIAGEHELPVPPLAEASAVELFVRRAREHDPRFDVDGDDLRFIAQICARIDRLPLAIELAAARTRVLTIPQILDRISERLEFLIARRRDAPERHRTLRAVLAWSYDLLEPEEQRLFWQLAVFHSGWTVEACEAVADGEVLDSLSGLIDHGLVIRDGTRFGMLETVREYALERLDGSPDATVVRRRHARWCVALAESAEQELEGREQASWFARLDAERENLRAAAAWALTNGAPEITLELDGALWRFWLARGAGMELRGELTAALGSGAGDPALRAKALNAAGVLAGEAGDLPAARASFEQALDLATQLADRKQMARTLMNLGVIALYTDDHATALARYQQAGDIWRDLDDLRGQSVMCQNLAIVYELMGRPEEAMPLLEQSVELARGAGDGMHIAQTLVELGKHRVRHGSIDERTPALLREGLELASALGEQRQIIEGLEVLAAFSAYTGAPVIGAELIGAAEAERARVDVTRMPDERPLFEATVGELEKALGREACERARDRGAGRGLETAVAVALESTSRDPGPRRLKHDANRRGPGLVLTEP
jgi:predicted ATPase/DNA-binding SARP family transcriptional activator